MPDGKPPALHGSDGVTQDYVWLQICEKFGGINLLDFFGVRKSEWQTEKGIKLKTRLFAYHQLNAQEEKRIHDEMDKKTKQNEDGRRKSSML